MNCAWAVGLKTGEEVDRGSGWEGVMCGVPLEVFCAGVCCST